MVCSLDSRQIVRAALVGALRELVCTQVLHQEVLLLVVRALDLVGNFFGEAVFNAATLDLRNLVVWMGAFDFIGPLHFFSLDDQLSSLSFSILSRSKRNNEIGTFLTIRFKLSTLWINSEFRC